MKTVELKRLLNWFNGQNILLVVGEDIGKLELPEIDQNYILDCFEDGNINGVKIEK